MDVIYFLNSNTMVSDGEILGKEESRVRRHVPRIEKLEE